MWTRTYRSALCVLFSYLLLVAGIATSAVAQTGTSNEWTWMGGASTLQCANYFCALPGVYGTLGTPAAGNIPGSRLESASWTDKEGNLWLFGGEIDDPAMNDGAVYGFLNDLWKFDISTNEWTWVAGSNTVKVHNGGGAAYAGQPGIYGMLGVAGAGNTPGGRWDPMEWADSSGNLWLFGGEGLDVNSTVGYLNDLWMFSPSTNEWTWVAGSNALSGFFSGPAGVYGTLGTPAAGNMPGGRSLARGWTDSGGRFWLFGGNGFDSSGIAYFYLNDLWMFDPTTSEWTWMSGNSEVLPNTNFGMPGVYGTLGVPASGNTPGNRWSPASWTDNMGNLWLFGGVGKDPNNNTIELNDLWDFNPFTKEWAWMGGSSTQSCPVSSQGCGQGGVYGTLGVPAAGNIPGSRAFASSWTDNLGDLWLSGGSGLISTGNSSLALNDLWEFNPATNEWAWMGGSDTGESPGVYGMLGTGAAGNTPGARTFGAAWTDNSGNFWLFGGAGYDATGQNGTLNDLWEFTPPAGSNPVAARPVFSEASGTYSSGQTVSISDDTTGATIYYTTDGVTIPTTSSTAYSGPITVSSTETIIAIAVSSGFSNSPVASATYTIKLPPTFTVATSPASFTVAAGSSGSTSVSVTPANGFSSAVSFACSGLPSGATCTFSPTTVTPTGTAAASTTLTVATSSTTAEMRRVPRPFLPVTTLAVALCCFGFRKRRGLLLALLVVVSAAGLVLVSGCGSNGPPPVQPVTSTITVTATSGTLQSTTTLSLTVN